MFTSILRKTFYKDLPHHAQDINIKLLKYQHLVDFLCTFFNIFFAVVPFLLPYIITNVYPNLSLQTKLLMMCILIAHFLYLTCFAKWDFLKKKIYFKFFTSKGNAITKNDFVIIKRASKLNEKLFHSEESLYKCIATQSCDGCCYTACFAILKILKKGSLLFAAVEDVELENEEKEFNYTMHVFYVKNGWAFDTFSHRQYPVQEVLNTMNAIVYKSFDFDYLKNMDYDSFRAITSKDLADWCKSHNCFESW